MRNEFLNGPTSDIWTRCNQFDKTFRGVNTDPLSRGVLNAALAMLTTASRMNELAHDQEKSRFETDPRSKRLHGEWFSGYDPVDTPSVYIGPDANGQEQVVIAGVADASSRHDLLLLSKIIGVRILQTGEVMVKRSPKVFLNSTDEELLEQVELELRRANTQAYVNSVNRELPDRLK